MLKQCLRSFAYIPKNKLEFKDGKCLLMEEKSIGNAKRLLKSSFFFSPSFTFLVSSGIIDLCANTLHMTFPFFIYYMYLQYFTINCIRKLYLDEDGKHIWVQKYLSKTLHKIRISHIELDEEKMFRKFFGIKKALIIDPKLTVLISKSSEIYHEDVLDRVLVCEEIQVNSLDE
ncbi:hypothetical protein SteCoe_6267 [Stentor coeruleus]|uniref:Uncharacterized protein n=1 Tax=Stentor coeruleus TaxID=5963 RepID=A0A1R2CQB2_9CILI|nr:hypothetical protein SteCoe_6267 [Stentor coeruleus]